MVNARLARADLPRAKEWSFFGSFFAKAQPAAPGRGTLPPYQQNRTRKGPVFGWPVNLRPCRGGIYRGKSLRRNTAPAARFSTRAAASSTAAPCQPAACPAARAVGSYRVKKVA